MKGRQSAKLRRLVYTALEDTKGADITVLDMRRVCDFTDYMVIASGTSARHVQSMADKVVEKLRAHDVKPLGIEGEAVGEWVLLDFGDLVLHLMCPQTRAFYDLERLWSDAKKVEAAGRPPEAVNSE